MFFLFGWGRRTTNEQGPTIAITCPNCSNDTWLHLLSYRSWFTIFFIPVIPYESKHLLLCPVCSRGLELQGDQVAKAKELNRLTGALLANEMTEGEYRAATERIALLR